MVRWGPRCVSLSCRVVVLVLVATLGQWNQISRLYLWRETLVAHLIQSRHSPPQQATQQYDRSPYVPHNAFIDRPLSLEVQHRHQRAKRKEVSEERKGIVADRSLFIDQNELPDRSSKSWKSTRNTVRYLRTNPFIFHRFAFLLPHPFHSLRIGRSLHPHPRRSTIENTQCIGRV